MKTKPLSLLLLAGLTLAMIVNTGSSFAQEPSPRSPQAGYSVYLPLVGKDSASQTSTAIVVDHRHTDVSRIPAQWITAARQMTVHYAHTSHGSQVLTGLNWLEGRNSTYNANIEANGTVIHPNVAAALNVYDGNNYPNDTYILPGMYWATTAGIDKTRSVVNTGWFDVSLWTWCGQMSTNSVAQTQQYLDVMAQLQAQYPDVTFVLYTGHTDGTTSGSTLWRNNQMVREYVQQHGGVLFDFADIESYDPDGNFYPTMNGTEGCAWCTNWCAAHPGHFACQAKPGCAHSDGLQCTLKGQAFWWLLARMAGWDGTPAQ